MIYFISDFGYFGHSSKMDKMEKHINQLKQKVQESVKNILFLGGDNFYPSGIKDADDRKLKLFNKYFNFIPKDRIYGIMGNHDYGGIVRHQMVGNNNFISEPRFYIVKSGNVDFYMIDTTIIDYMSYTDISCVYENLFPESYNEFHKTMIGEAIDISIKRWTAFKEKMSNDLFQYRRTMLEDLDYSFKNSIINGQKIIIVGHYPPQSFGSYYAYNNKNIIMKHIGVLMLKYNINYYISGHDHNNQHIFYDERGLYDLVTKKQVFTLYDDGVFIGKIMDDYHSVVVKEGKIGDGLHIFINGSFVDNYDGYYEIIKGSINARETDNVIMFDSTKNAYLKIDSTPKNILISFIDLETNHEFYSSNHILQ